MRRPRRDVAGGALDAAREGEAERVGQVGRLHRAALRLVLALDLDPPVAVPTSPRGLIAGVPLPASRLNQLRENGNFGDEQAQVGQHFLVGDSVAFGGEPLGVRDLNRVGDHVGTH